MNCNINIIILPPDPRLKNWPFVPDDEDTWAWSKFFRGRPYKLGWMKLGDTGNLKRKNMKGME